MLLIIGLIMFIGVHMVPYIPLRATLISRLGPNAYRGAFSLVSFIGIVLLCIGYSRVPVEWLFQPAPWARIALSGAMPVVLILFAAANMPTHIRQVLRHPMMIGTFLWAVLHFLANGERAASILFGAFALWAAVSVVVRICSPRISETPPRAPAWKFDAIAVAAGLVATVVIYQLHGLLFGVPIMG